MIDHKKSFFEYIGIADVEKVHSQILAWIFSNDCTALDSKTKKQLLEKIFNLNNIGEILNTQTEREGIDILIQTEKKIIVIENKIKSSQHSDQLKKYKEYCKKEFPTILPSFHFLTLIGECSNEGEWQNETYWQIYNVLNELEFNTSNSDSTILKEYIHFLSRLTWVVSDFIQNVQKYDMVFKDGAKKKSDKLNSIYNNLEEEFIAMNQLETILQKAFLSSIVERIGIGSITETRGAALIDFIIQEKIGIENKYKTFIQIQQETIKFSYAITENYSQSSSKWVEEIIPLMKKISAENEFNYKRVNKPKNKAYLSISKKMDTPYWKMETDELINYLKTEIANGKILTERLINLFLTSK